MPSALDGFKTGQKVYLGFSILQNPRAVRYRGLMEKDGTVDLGLLELAMLPWEWNEGNDGSVLAGPDWLPTISLPGCG